MRSKGLGAITQNPTANVLQGVKSLSLFGSVIIAILQTSKLEALVAFAFYHVNLRRPDGYSWMKGQVVKHG